MTEKENIVPVKPYIGAKRGPKPKSGKTKVHNKLAMICIEALEVLDKAVKGEPISQERLRACTYAINQDIGSPATKIGITEAITIVVKTAKPPANIEKA